MRAKFSLGILVVTVLTFGLIAAGSLFIAHHVEAQPPLSTQAAPPLADPAPTDSEPSVVRPVPLDAPKRTDIAPTGSSAVAEQPPSHAGRDNPLREIVPAKPRRVVPVPQMPEGPQTWPLVIRCTTSVAPIFEGGAIGQRVPIIVEIRKDPRFNEENIPPEAWQQNLPEKVKQAVQAALAEAAGEEPPVDRRLDQVLERLDKIEQQLNHLERQKSSSRSQ